MKEPPSENKPLRNQNTLIRTESEKLEKGQANTGGLEDRDMNSMFKVLPKHLKPILIWTSPTLLHNLNLF